MGFIIGVVKRLLKFSLYFAIFSAIVILIPNLPPYTTFSSRKLEPTLPRVGPLAHNTALNNAKKLYLNKVHGPEAFKIFNGELYTGMATGEVVKISPGHHVTFVTKIGKPCSDEWQEETCGRPLGLDIDEKNKQLYVADAYYGIWKVDLKTDKKQLLVSPKVEIEKRTPKLFNSIALSKNGDFYWTDSSSDFILKDGVYGVLTDPTGRLLYYNSAKNQSKVLIDGLWFANGVAISPDNQFVVVAETSGFKLLRYYIDGPKRGQSDVFIQGLPGTPDNLQALPDGSGILIGLYTMFDDQHPLLLRSMAPVPLVRKFLARMLKFIELPFKYANNVYPHNFFEYMTFMIGNFRSMAMFSPPLSGILQIDWNGKIVGLYMNTDSTLKSISDAVVFNDMLYTGSPHNHFIGAVTAPEGLKKAFSSSKKSPPVKTAETVTERIPNKIESKPVEQKPVKTAHIKKESVKNIHETEKKAPAKQPSKDIPKPQKPVEQNKPSERPKTEGPQSTTPKPHVEQKLSTQNPKEVEPKVSTTTSRPIQVTPPTPKQAAPPVPKKETPPTPKPSAPNAKSKEGVGKQAEKPKAAEPNVKQKKIEPEVKQVDKSTTNAQKEKPVEKQKINKNTQDQKPVPEQIPIKEEIPSDTIKPDAPKLKVIKKEGPTEIPNPHI